MTQNDGSHAQQQAALTTDLFTDMAAEDEQSLSGGFTVVGRPTTVSTPRQSFVVGRPSTFTPSVPGARGVYFDWNIYFYVLGVASVVGNPGVTSNELDFAFQKSFIFW